MPIFEFGGRVTVSAAICVEADTLEEAREIAEASAIRDFCFQCANSNNAGDPEWVIDNDGSIVDIQEV